MNRKRSLRGRGPTILGLAALALLTHGCGQDDDGGGVVRPSPAPPPPLATPRIAFTSNRTGTGGIHLYDPDTGGIVRLSPAGVYDQEAVISPNGERIAFVTYDAGVRFRLMTMAVDGSDRRACTPQASVNEIGPRWSPDSRRLVFTRADPASGLRTVWTILADGDSLTAVTDDGHSTALDWSPDGQFLLIARDSTVTTYTVHELRLVRPDGSGGRALYPGSAFPFVGAEFSPDGTRIAFTQAGGADTYLFVGNSDGAGWVRYSTLLALDGVGRPSWSPDGGTIVFSGHRTRETDDLFTVDLALPYDVRPLLGGTAWDSAPHWGPKP